MVSRSLPHLRRHWYFLPDMFQLDVEGTRILYHDKSHAVPAHFSLHFHFQLLFPVWPVSRPSTSNNHDNKKQAEDFQLSPLQTHLPSHPSPTFGGESIA